MTTISSLHFQIPAGQAPEWVHLTPAGTFSGVDGRGPFTLQDAAAVITASMAAGKLPIDENHSTDKAAPEGRPAPARGWIVEMQLRDDGLWGRVDWTATGKRLVEEHEYRGISPVFVSETAGGKVVRILRAALTNDPNLTLTTLHSRTPDMDFLAKLRTALGLKADAAEDAVLTAVTSHAAIAAAQDKLLDAAGLKGDARQLDLVSHVTTLAADAAKLGAISVHFKSAGLDLAKLSPKDLETHLQARGDSDAAELRQTNISLQSRLTALEQSTSRDKAEAFIDGAIRSGKPLLAMRDHYVARHQKDPAGVEKEVDALPSIHDGGVRRPPPDGALSLHATTAEVIAAADRHIAEQKKNGTVISSTDAILHVTGRR
ncbi:phage protease [Bosea sp. (in: a-proteobacteria)]|uniref:phage protease n=1 Tax=Bosea sp. (in: a-proteobacteria) TaxID=1871050 RepID=UPI00273552C9|nr:phage protease [Bosea sp. (in: a-proteobacteria)]MDP3408198.1 phage protease [Bosea sp. (in: a-proteobacteria)]